MARRIMVVAGLMIAVGAYFVFLQERDDFLYLLGAGLVTMTVAWVFQYQIDHLMMRGVPQRLDEPVRDMLTHTSRHFAALDLNGRMMAEDRMARWLAPREVIAMSDPQPPEEAKHIVAWYAALLTLHQERYLFKGLDRIVFYHHPFLTPARPDDVHIFELETGDGTMIFSLPHLIKGHAVPGHYNIALHVMAAAYTQYYRADPVGWPDTIWDELEAISGYSRHALETYTGMPMDDPWPVAVHHQVMFPTARIQQVMDVLPQLRNE